MAPRRGWEVTLLDGTSLFEGQVSWKEVPKKNIKELALNYMGRRWTITGKKAYFVNTRASMSPGVQESFRVEETTIGYYEGSSKVYYTVNELTGKFSIKVLDPNGQNPM